MRPYPNYPLPKKKKLKGGQQGIDDFFFPAHLKIEV